MLSTVRVYFSQSQPMIRTLNEPFSVCYTDQSRVVSPISPYMSIPNVRKKVALTTFAPFRSFVTPAPSMSVEQTSIWIWTFGYQRCWIEAEYYATQFNLWRVHGKVLPMLMDDGLKRIGILDNFHREMILSVIRWLFPSNSENDMSSTCASSVTAMGERSSDELDEGKYFEELESSISSSQSDESVESSRCFRESFFETRRLGKARKRLTSRMADIANTATSLRTKKTFLWPNSDESKLNEEKQMKCFYSKFKKLGYDDFKISRRNVNDGSFVVEFADVRVAQKALNEAQEIGNILKSKKFKRPTPTCPCAFIVLSSNLQIREARTLTSRKIGKEKKGEVLLVNRTKGRRARLCKEENDGNFKTIGWASLFTKEGCPLMLQLEEDSSDNCVQNKMDLDDK